MSKNIKKSFTENQLKGNWGEQYIASELAACDCLVRHVPQGHDSGIDLYCECIKNGIPFLHFFVQVKTSNTYKTSVEEYSFSLPLKENEKSIYWTKQPVPVFIFLVPDERNKPNTPFFICSSLDFKNGKKTIKSRIKINNKDELKKRFLGENDNSDALLIKETFEWSLARGHLAPLPKIEESSLKWFPEGIMNNVSNINKVSSTLHDALWRISEDLLGEKYFFKKLQFKNESDRDLSHIKPYIKALEAIVETNKSSNVSRITIGIWYAANDNYIISREWIIKGIEIAKKNISNSRDGIIKTKINNQLAQSEEYLKIVNNRIKNN